MVLPLGDEIECKTNTIIVSRSRTMYPQSPSLNTGGTVLKESDDLSFYIGSDI